MARTVKESYSGRSKTPGASTGDVEVSVTFGEVWQTNGGSVVLLSTQVIHPSSFDSLMTMTTATAGTNRKRLSLHLNFDSSK